MLELLNVYGKKLRRTFDSELRAERTDETKHAKQSMYLLIKALLADEGLFSFSSQSRKHELSLVPRKIAAKLIIG